MYLSHIKLFNIQNNYNRNRLYKKEIMYNTGCIDNTVRFTPNTYIYNITGGKI